MKGTNRYRLGLDLGTNSLGWCAVALDSEGKPSRFLRMGVRIFPDSRNPKDGSSLAAARRLARSMRRRRDRFLKRRQRLMRLMVEHGLMPADPDQRKQLRRLDPYELRRKGLDEALTPYQFGRVLFHLNQRRGFRSNRRADRRADDDSGKLKAAVRIVTEQMEKDGARTVGEWLAQRHAVRSPVRARLRGQGPKSQYELYVDRQMIEAEFDALWSAQAKLNPGVFSPTARGILRDALLFQRHLRPVVPGRCTFETDEPRAPLALPSVQRFRIFQEANNLRVAEPGQSERPLTTVERDELVHELLRVRERKFDRIRKLLRLPADSVFNLESAKRDRLKGDATTVSLAHPKAFGPEWHTLALSQQDDVVTLLLEAERDETVTTALADRYGLGPDAASEVAAVALVEGYGSLSRKAISRILPLLEAEVVTYDVAAGRAGYEHTSSYAGGDLLKLPYYAEFVAHCAGTGTGDPSHPAEKRFGRIPNPTVHVALNQLRCVVNALITKYGRPEEIVIELVRDLKLSRERRRDLERQQKQRQDDNDRYRKMLQEIGLPPKPGNLMRLRLWEELGPNPLDRRCPYTGDMISVSRLFSPEVEDEHILPFAMTFDDSVMNRTVAMRRANRAKTNQSPFQAFGHSPPGYDWESIVERIASMPYAKRQRFAPDALDRFQQEGDFLARQLTDTAYVTRVAREYLTAVCPSNRVWAVPGRLTAILRARWGLNTLLSDADTKNRTDQRHHAIDAAVVAVTDRALLQRASRLASRQDQEGVGRILEGLEEPWPGFRQGLAFGLEKVLVSYKPDHGVGARLHNDTAYGLVDGNLDVSKPATVVHRVPLASIKSVNDADRIRDPAIRERVQAIATSRSGKELVAALEAFSQETGIRRVRVTEQLTVIPIRRADGAVYKAYKGDSNYCFEISLDGRSGRWRDEVISSFQAASGHADRQSDDIVMRLCALDCVRIDDGGGGQKIYRVVKFSVGRLVLAPLHEGGKLKERDADRSDSFKYLTCSASRLQQLNAYRVVIDPIGQSWPIAVRHARANSRDSRGGEIPVLS